MKKKLIMWSVLLLLLVTPQLSHAMHIMEGFLPLKWAIVWAVLSLPFLIAGFKKLSKGLKPEQKMFLGLVGGFAFVLSALKIPSVTGSCSHPTGVGLGAIMFGPATMTVIGSIVLLFQSLLLAHGGITTLGANVFSMAVVGPLVSFWIYKSLKNKNKGLAVFLAAALGDLATYIITSIQLSIAFPDATGGFFTSLTKFISIFAVTQLPLAIVEGIITLMVFNLILEYKKEGVIELEESI